MVGQMSKMLKSYLSRRHLAVPVFIWFRDQKSGIGPVRSWQHRRDAALIRSAGRNVHIYDSSNLDFVLGRLILTNGVRIPTSTR
jgi:hypothetical protein